MAFASPPPTFALANSVMSPWSVKLLDWYNTIAVSADGYACNMTAAGTCALGVLVAMHVSTFGDTAPHLRRNRSPRRRGICSRPHKARAAEQFRITAQRRERPGTEWCVAYLISSLVCFV